MAYSAIEKMRKKNEQIISHYQGHLSKYETQNNRLSFNNMLKLMRKFDGVRIYQYESHDVSRM